MHGRASKGQSKRPEETRRRIEGPQLELGIRRARRHRAHSLGHARRTLARQLASATIRRAQRVRGRAQRYHQQLQRPQVVLGKLLYNFNQFFFYNLIINWVFCFVSLTDRQRLQIRVRDRHGGRGQVDQVLVRQAQGAGRSSHVPGSRRARDRSARGRLLVPLQECSLSRRVGRHSTWLASSRRRQMRESTRHQSHSHCVQQR